MGKVNIDFTPTKYNADDAPDLVTGAYNQSMDDLKEALDNATAEDGGGGGFSPVLTDTDASDDSRFVFVDDTNMAQYRLGTRVWNWIKGKVDTLLANYLPLTGGTLTGTVNINQGSGSSIRLKIIRSDASSNVFTFSLSGENGLLALRDSENNILNSIVLAAGETSLKVPLALDSGGTGASTAEQARENLGIIDPTPVYVETEETTEPGLHIIVDSENNVLKIKKV